MLCLLEEVGDTLICSQFSFAANNIVVLFHSHHPKVLQIDVIMSKSQLQDIFFAWSNYKKHRHATQLGKSIP